MRTPLMGFGWAGSGNWPGHLRPGEAVLPGGYRLATLSAVSRRTSW